MTVMGFSLMGCCTPAHTCGIDTTAFGMSGCNDISMFMGGGASKACGLDTDAGTEQ
jgi:hypothetical protein